MTSISKIKAFSLLEKYHADPHVIAHVTAVHDYAMEMADKVDCDRPLVEAGSLLHDIGRCQSHGMDHGIIGAEILRKEGIDERIVYIVERHVGAGLTAQEALKLGLPAIDLVPETIEEKIVCHADNLIGSTERVSIQETIKMANKKWFPESVERLRTMHFEVFRPDIVLLKENALKAANGELRAIEVILKRSLKVYDLLYLINMDDGRCTLSLYGQDSGKAADHLVNKGIVLRA
jgi:uncharacterized protein